MNDEYRLDDIARKVSDRHNEILSDLRWAACGKWMAFRLSDGGDDGNLYDTRERAIYHQLHETQCVYICIQPTGLVPRSAAIFIRNMRELYQRGSRRLPQIDLDPSYQGW